MITGVILARNEERNIVTCLRALQPHVQEILLIDMESSDRTVELARPFVAKVLSHALMPNFDSARNLAIPEAKCEWLWFVDADEVIPEATGRLARDLVAKQGHEIVAIHIPFKSYFCGKWIQHSSWWPGYTGARLLKRGHFQWSKHLHGGVEYSGNALRVPPDPALGIDHYSYRDIRHWVEKSNNYTSTEALNLQEKGVHWDWEAATRHMTRELWWFYERTQGRLDAEHGWVLAWLTANYRWLSHAKLLDLDKPTGEGPPNIPDSLDTVLEVMESELSRARASLPQLPLEIVLHSPIWDDSHFAHEGRLLALALANGQRPLALRETNSDLRPYDLESADRALLKALVRAKRPKFAVSISNCEPMEAQCDPSASLNVLRIGIVTDRVPPIWLDRLGHFDELWTPSRHSALALIQSGVASEKVRVVPSGLNTDLYRPKGAKLKLPESLASRFVFLSVFPWELSAGWDLLLRTYCQQFGPNDGAALLLTVQPRSHQTFADVLRSIDAFVAEIGERLEDRPDIVVWEQQANDKDRAALCRSVDAFILPSRGDAFGQSCMEAMATGLPVIGTAAFGNFDFMNDGNSLLVSAERTPVPLAAVEENPFYAGHQWFEPDRQELADAMVAVQKKTPQVDRVAAQAAADIKVQFNLAQMQVRVERALEEIEAKFVYAPLPEPATDQIPVDLEGEYFAGHSFSVVNEKLAAEFLKDSTLAFSARQVSAAPPADQISATTSTVRSAINRRLPDGPAVTIRHKFPPNWSPPEKGAWVHVQPWESGYLPQDWLKPLQEQVDEIWVPSNYVRNVYIRSGIPGEKVQVIPWGIDPKVFHAEVPPLLLQTRKTFRFLFVGGAISRKGFDLLLSAYLGAFRPTDDACLVVKDMGADTFYRMDSFRERILQASQDERNPEILYVDRFLSEGQLATLYAASDCLVAPYRGEGFGLPILEAMACGLPVMVPREGPSDDFTTPDDAFYLPTQIVETTHPWKLCGPPTELAVHPAHLAHFMRQAYENRGALPAMGLAGSQRILKDFTWAHTAQRMRARIEILAKRSERNVVTVAPNFSDREGARQAVSVSACLIVGNHEATLADCLARLNEQSIEPLVVLSQSSDRSLAIAQEYCARIFHATETDLDSVKQAAIRGAKSEWVLFLAPDELLLESEAKQLKLRVAEANGYVLAIRCHVENSSKEGTSELRLIRKRLALNCNGDLSAEAERMRSRIAVADFRIVSA